MRRTVTTTDGLSLALYRSETPGRPVLVAVHGYPDDASVWDGMAALLVDDFDIVAYDVRGAGASSRPRAVRSYRLEQLTADLTTVIDSVSPTAPVHVVAHDWGSVQVFYALRHGLGRIASFTSISGPDLDAAGAWMRRQLSRGPAGWAEAARQVAASWYIGAFLVPGPVEMAIRRGLVGRVVAAARDGRSASGADLVDGLRLYRANMLRRRPPGAAVEVPVQVIAPLRDRYIRPSMATEIGDWARDLRVRRPDAGHWLILSDPAYIATHLRLRSLPC
jgi:pimeloyl-ACP methyl ester carboxylesterase